MRNARRRVFVAAQWLFAAAIVWYAATALEGQWAAAADRLATLQLSWPLIALASAIVLATYLLLIDAWRRVITASGGQLTFGAATRIWFVSNLGKYLPGKLWSLAAIATMAREHRVSAVTAAGASLLVQLVSIATGIGVVVVTGAQALDQPAAAVVIGSLLLLLLLAIPWLLPLAGKVVETVSGRRLAIPSISAATVWVAALQTAVAWIAYGLAFRLIVEATLGSAAGATTSYIAVFAASYIIGFVALFAPGGAVVRESAMIAGMLKLGLAGEADALAIAVACRLWLTVTELVPGLTYLALGKRAARTIH